jgi:hypothetical protein
LPTDSGLAGYVQSQPLCHCGALSPFSYSAGPSIELVGDTSADASGIGNYILQCSLRCIRQFQNRLYIHGFTLKSAIGVGSMGVETLGKEAVTEFGDIRAWYFDDNLGQPFGAGLGGTQFFSGKYILDTNAAQLIVGSEHARFTFLPSFNLVLPGARNILYWIELTTGSIADTFVGPPTISGPGATMQNGGTPVLCTENSIVSMGGGLFPGNQPVQKYTGCVVNGQ